MTEYPETGSASSLGMDIMAFLGEEESALRDGRTSRKAIEAAELDALLWVLEQKSKERPKREEWTRFAWHPSSAGKCPRQLWLSTAGAYKDPRSVDQLGLRKLVFSNGDFFHYRTQANLYRMGRLVECEKPLAMKEDGLQFVGSCDGVVLIEGLPFVLELKSINDRGFKEVQKTADDGSYSDQIQLYMAMSGVPATVILYEDKDNQKPEARFVRFDQGILDRIKETLKDVQARLEACGDPPPKPKKGEVDCFWCDYKGVCDNSLAIRSLRESIGRRAGS